MNEDMRKLIDKILPAVLKDARIARKFNSIAPVSGTRHMLPLEGRDIEIVYYKAESEKAPLIMGFHGGGFLYGGCALDDDLWKNVSKILDVNVAAVDYRLSPKAKDYDCLNDCYDSMIYMYEHSEEFGFDRNHISTFGSSAGGNLSAAAAILANQRKEITLDNQILMYPFLDGYTDPDSKGEGSFSGPMCHIMNELHFSPEKADDPLLSPIFAGRELLEGLPKAIVCYSENDNLRYEAIRYCEMLRQAGVDTVEFMAKGMPHGYIEMGFKDHFTDIERNMLGENADELIAGGMLNVRSAESLELIKREMIR